MCLQECFLGWGCSIGFISHSKYPVHCHYFCLSRPRCKVGKLPVD